MDTKNSEGEGSLTMTAGKRTRVNRNVAQWAELIEAHRRSGLTIEAFCRQERISRSSFTRWRGELAERGGAGHEPADFLAIPIHRGGIEVEVGGMCIRLEGGFSSRMLETLLDRVRQTP